MKQRKNNEIENMRREALEESEKQVNWKQIEDEAIRDLLNAQNLKLHEVRPFRLKGPLTTLTR